MTSSIRTPFSDFLTILCLAYMHIPSIAYLSSLKKSFERLYEYLREALSKTVESMPLLGGTVVLRQSGVQDTREERLEIVVFPPHRDDCVVPLPPFPRLDCRL